MIARTDRHLPRSRGGDDGAGPLATGAVSDRTRRRRRVLLGIAIAAPLVMGGCGVYPTYGASRGGTKQAHDIFKLYSGMMTTGIVVGGLVALLIIYTLIRYRKRSDEMPRQFHESIPIEILYTIIPVLIVAVIFGYTVLTENNVDATVPATATVTTTGTPVVDIRVTAFQWGWRFDYPHLDIGVGGETTEGPGNRGPQMVVPVGQTVQISLVSDDVVHAFYVRDFNFNRQALPGVTNVFDLTVLRSGTYNGQCIQFCGLYHAEMLFSVKAVSPPAFRAWARAEVAAGHTLVRSGSPASNNAPPNTHVTPSNASPATGQTPKEHA